MQHLDQSTAVEPRLGHAGLSVKDVTVQFAGITALDTLSFDVAPGKIHALIGPNGAGKSTCLNVISGLYKPTSGHVTFDGENITNLSPQSLPGLGIARSFQNLALSPTQTVTETLMVGRYAHTRSGFLGAGLRGPRSRAEERAGRKAVAEVAEVLDLGSRLTARVSDLNYGDRKRLDLARALCMEPKLLLLDEPVAGMHAEEAHLVADTIVNLRQMFDVAVLLIEHNMSVVMKIADHVTVVDFGRFVASGTPTEVQSNPDVLTVYLGESDTEEAS